MPGPKFRHPFFIDVKANDRALFAEFDCEGKAYVTQTDDRQFQIFHCSISAPFTRRLRASTKASAARHPWRQASVRLQAAI